VSKLLKATDKLLPAGLGFATEESLSRLCRAVARHSAVPTRASIGGELHHYSRRRQHGRSSKTAAAVEASEIGVAENVLVLSFVPIRDRSSSEGCR